MYVVEFDLRTSAVQRKSTARCSDQSFSWEKSKCSIVFRFTLSRSLFGKTGPMLANLFACSSKNRIISDSGTANKFFIGFTVFFIIFSKFSRKLLKNFFEEAEMPTGWFVVSHRLTKFHWPPKSLSCFNPYRRKKLKRWRRQKFRANVQFKSRQWIWNWKNCCNRG